jgi:hypothetical protein
MDDTFRTTLSSMTPKSRDMLRLVLIRDRADRDTVARALLRNGNRASDWVADIISSLTTYPDARRSVVRMLAEIDAAA